MNTEAFAITFIDTKTGRASPVRIFSEPCPTCKLSLLPLVVHHVVDGADYAKARDTLINHLNSHPFNRSVRQDPSGAPIWYWIGDRRGVPRDTRLAEATAWAASRGFKPGQPSGVWWESDVGWILIGDDDDGTWWFQTTDDAHSIEDEGVGFATADDALIAAHESTDYPMEFAP